jgi:hypothetical protein
MRLTQCHLILISVPADVRQITAHAAVVKQTAVLTAKKRGIKKNKTTPYRIINLFSWFSINFILVL